MIDFKKIDDMDKPRERLYRYGADSLSNEELIAIIIGTGSKNMNVMELSLKILETVGDISKFMDIGINNLMGITGIGKTKAISIKAAIELGKRVYYDKKIDKIKLNNSRLIYDYFYYDMVNKKQEYFYCVYLDTKGYLITSKCIFIGTINSSLVHPREIFKEAYMVSASGIICVHNHPTGDITPSREDINITRNIKEISIIHGIKFIDHIIIGKDKYYSFYEDGKL